MAKDAQLNWFSGDSVRHPGKPNRGSVRLEDRRVVLRASCATESAKNFLAGAAEETNRVRRILSEAEQPFCSLHKSSPARNLDGARRSDRYVWRADQCPGDPATRVLQRSGDWFLRDGYCRLGRRHRPPHGLRGDDGGTFSITQC